MTNTSLSRKKILFSFLVLSLFFPNLVKAQFGINAGYQVNQIDGWALNTNGITSDITGNGVAVGLDYWFRLKNQRIEFLPELNYTSFESIHFENNDFIDEVGFKIEFFSFYFNTNIYLLDFLGDCDCPTFSKQNNFFKKGFFIQISPGLTLPNFEYTNDQASQSGSIQANIALGAGLDIGLTDLITLTPLIRARYQPNMEWNATFPDPNDLSNPDVNPPNIGTPSANIVQYYAGLRLGIRLDNW